MQTEIAVRKEIFLCGELKSETWQQLVGVNLRGGLPLAQEPFIAPASPQWHCILLILSRQGRSSLQDRWWRTGRPG